MAAHNKQHDLTPILVGFSLLLIGIFQVMALRALTERILDCVRESSGLIEKPPITSSPCVSTAKEKRTLN